MRSSIARSLGLATVVLLAPSCGAEPADEQTTAPDSDSADMAEDPEPEPRDDELTEVAVPESPDPTGPAPGSAIVEIGSEVVTFTLDCEGGPSTVLVSGEGGENGDWSLAGLFRGDPDTDILGVSDGRTETEWGIAPSLGIGAFDGLTMEGEAVTGAGTFGLEDATETLAGRFEINCSASDAATAPADDRSESVPAGTAVVRLGDLEASFPVTCSGRGPTDYYVDGRSEEPSLAINLRLVRRDGTDQGSAQVHRSGETWRMGGHLDHGSFDDLVLDVDTWGATGSGLLELYGSPEQTMGFSFAVACG